MTQPIARPRVPATAPSTQTNLLPRLEITAEPVVAFVGSELRPLYQECRPRILVEEDSLLAVADVEATDLGLLDAAVVDLVLAALADAPDVTLGCNVSARTLSDRAAATPILRRLAAEPDLARRLVIEVAEGMAFAASDPFAGALTAAQAAGCRLALDDFGTRGTVSRRPSPIAWDIVKIDRDGVLGQRNGRPEREVLAALVADAAERAPCIVIEGTETSAHVATARAAGATGCQGGVFPAPKIDRWCALEGATGLRIANALLHHGAVASRPEIAWPGDNRDLALLLTRVDGIGGWVKALAARARAGRNAIPKSSAPYFAADSMV